MNKKNIRQGVFETNSSSTHSVSIAPNNLMLMDTSIIPDQHGKIQLTGGEFGWEFVKYNDALTKANYLAVALHTFKGWKERDREQFSESFRDGFAKSACDNYEAMFAKFEKVMKEQTGCEEINFEIGAEEYSSYIDHQSIDSESADCYEILIGAEENMRNFIFNKNSWLFTGNDNSSPDPTFYDVPLFKDGKKIMPEYKYKLQVEGYKKTTKFKDKPNKEELDRAFDSLLGEVHLSENGHFDDENSVYAQILRDDTKYFKFSSYGHDSVTDTQVIFRKDAYQDAFSIYKRKFPKDDWQKDKGWEKTKDIEKQLEEEQPEKYIRKINYHLTEI